jgi:hypothetical protein
MVRGPDGAVLPCELVKSGDVVIRRFGHDYDHDGQRWRQHQYVVALGDDRAVMLTAQAPMQIWDEVELAALEVAGSVAPMSG